MIKLIKFILFSIIGLVASFLVLIIFDEGIHSIVTCGIVGLTVSAIVNSALEKKELRIVLSIVSFIIAFFLYLWLYSYVNDEVEGMFWGILVFGAPYILAACAIIEGNKQ